MSDEDDGILSAQNIIQKWAHERHYSTTSTTAGSVYFHYSGRNGFAILNFKNSPYLKLAISKHIDVAAFAGLPYKWPSIEQPPWKEAYRPPRAFFYDINLGDPNCFAQLELILEQAILNYISGVYGPDTFKVDGPRYTIRPMP